MHNEFVRWDYGRAQGIIVRLATVVSELAGEWPSVPACCGKSKWFLCRSCHNCAVMVKYL